MEKDSHLYQFVFNELNENYRNHSLWIKATILSEENEEQIKPLYIKLRVENIKNIFKNAAVDYTKCAIEDLNDILLKIDTSVNWINTIVDFFIDYELVHDLTFMQIYIYNKSWQKAHIVKEKLLRTISLNLNNTMNTYVNNRIKTIPNEICHLSNLQYLNLYGNELLHLPSTIRQLTKLEHLDLSYNFGIKQLEIYTISGLTHLSLTRCNFKVIDSGIKNLKNLHKLDLNENSLEYLPSDISELVKLEILNLEFNSFKNFPHEAYCLNNLKYLNLSHNYITELPIEIGNMTNLISLELKNNNLMALPSSIIKLKKLKKLNLKMNPNLLLSSNQKEYIAELIKNGCKVQVDDNILDKISRDEIVQKDEIWLPCF